MSQQLRTRPPEAAPCATRADRNWVRHALRLLDAEAGRSGWTPLLPFRVRGLEGVDLYLKDESLHPTGSLKHRLARSLFVQALCNGDIGPRTTIIEASSGSTAVSEAYFAQILGLPFVAVLPRATSYEKIALIERHGGRVEMVDDPTHVVRTAERLAEGSEGFFMDQFTFASQATNWRDDNIASEMFSQMSREPHPVPEWVVVGAGTGGTSTCIARYARHKGIGSRVAVVDPDGSAFYEGWRRKDMTFTTSTPSRIEGIGRTRVEPSFVPNLVDEVIPVPDGASIATMRWASDLLGRRVGPSTGTNIWGALRIAQRMRASRREGSVATVICDSGERYASTYYDDAWVAARGIDPTPWNDLLSQYQSTGLPRAD
ncbi:PLP-dependent cysteine synthase family protein [Microbacterium sp. 22242]|uniref:PLP-dependent cysteine synthase family protein n=1 Tax=Microbacterium sp. 22242 TaxID=3453896 RepID=UPI003F84F79C